MTSLLDIELFVPSSIGCLKYLLILFVELSTFFSLAMSFETAWAALFLPLFVLFFSEFFKTTCSCVSSRGILDVKMSGLAYKLSGSNNPLTLPPSERRTSDCLEIFPWENLI